VLIARGPSFRQQVVSELPSGNVDITPTVLRLLGVTTDAGLDGRPLLEGLRAAADQPRAASVTRRYETPCRIGGVGVLHRAVVESVGLTRYVASLAADRL
jgi:arylsulfatase A-like enzyme